MSVSAHRTLFLALPLLAFWSTAPAQAQRERLDREASDARCVELVLDAQTLLDGAAAAITIGLAGDCGRALEGIAFVSLDGEMVGRVAIASGMRAMLELDLPARDPRTLDRLPQACVRAVLRPVAPADRGPRLSRSARPALGAAVSTAQSGSVGDRRPGAAITLGGCTVLGD